MKKIIIPVICILLAFSACSDNTALNKETTGGPSSSTTANSYIGDGFKETLSLLVESNRLFVNEVFINRTLTVDDTAPKKDGLTTYYPVVSDKISSYSSLADRVKATYTENAASELLDGDIYKEIDGKLYCKNKHTLKHKDEALTEIKIEGISVTNEKCVFNFFTEDGEKIEMTAVNENGTWKLEKVYTEI